MKIIIKNIIFISIFLLSSCTTTATTTPELEEITFKLSWHDGVQFLGYYIADEKAYYAEEGLTIAIESLSETSENNTIPHHVADGTFDFGISGSVLISNQIEGILVTAISSSFQLSPKAFFARSDSGIITPADLAGRRIIIKTEGWRISLEALLAHANLSLEDVEIVEGGFDMTPFFEGEVEVWSGFLTNEVIRARQQGLDLVTFPLYEYGINDSPAAIIASQDFLENNPELAVRFLRASLRGWEWAIDNPTQAVDLMLERFPELADDHDFHLASFNAYIPLIRPLGQQIGTIDCELWRNDERFDALDSIDNLCTTAIFEQAINN